MSLLSKFFSGEQNAPPKGQNAVNESSVPADDHIDGILIDDDWDDFDNPETVNVTKTTEEQLRAVNAECADLKYRLQEQEEDYRHLIRRAMDLEEKLDTEKTKRKTLQNALKRAQDGLNELDSIRVAVDAENALEGVQRLLEDVERMRSIVEDDTQTIARLTAQNDNLMRISRERANAERGLRPKRQHTGYVVLNSRQRVQWLKDRKTEILYETRLQSPYKTSTEMRFAEKYIRADLFSEKQLLRAIGITGQYSGGFDAWISERERNRQPDESNMVLSYTLNQNFQKGFWEIFITHTAPLSDTPYEMSLIQ